MNQIWQMWGGALPPELCDFIINECELYQITDDENFSNRVDRSISRWIDKKKDSSKFISEIVQDFGWEANRLSFGLDIDYLRDMEFVEYHATEESEHEFIQDTIWGNPLSYDKKLTVIIQLSSPEDYEGGEFLIDPNYGGVTEDFIQRGSILVLPSPIKYSSTPITSGVRKTLVGWIEGPKFR